MIYIFINNMGSGGKGQALLFFKLWFECSQNQMYPIYDGNILFFFLAFIQQ